MLTRREMLAASAAATVASAVPAWAGMLGTPVDWRPIATAPQMTPVMVYDPGDRWDKVQVRALLRDENARQEYGEREWHWSGALVTESQWLVAPKDFRTSGGMGLNGRLNGPEPTHWAPILSDPLPRLPNVDPFYRDWRSPDTRYSERTVADWSPVNSLADIPVGYIVYSQHMAGHWVKKPADDRPDAPWWTKDPGPSHCIPPLILPA